MHEEPQKANGWFNEHLFFSRIEIAEGNGKEKCGPVGIEERKAKVGDYTWSYRVRNGKAVIVSNTDSGYQCAVSPKPTGHITIPAKLGGVKVTCIGKHALIDCDEMKSVTIPEGVTHIEMNAFGYCDGITEVTIPPTVTSLACGAFGNCKELASVTIPPSVRNIGWWAFVGTKLKTLTIPSGVKEIYYGAFSLCHELASVTMGEEIPEVDRSIFDDCGKLKEIHVPANAKSWAGMTEWQGRPLVFDGKETIGDYSWSYRVQNGEATIVAEQDGKHVCAVSPKPTGHISIPSTLGGVKVSSIGEHALFECEGLTSVAIPSRVKNIYNGAFYYCSGLTTFEIPPSVTHVEPTAFTALHAVKSFAVDADNPAYSSRNGLLCSKDGTILIAGVNGEVTIPSGVVTIGRQSFLGRGLPMSVMIPSSVTNIEDGAFAYCCGLASVTMLGERPGAGKGVFGNCAKLKAIHVPANAKSWAGMKEWQGIPLVFDAKADGVVVGKARTTIQSIIDGMIKVPGRDYWLSETELTQGQWEAVMGYNLSAHKGANLPVENVSRDDCDVFLEKLNQTKEVRSSRFVFGLPTLSEWRHAALAGGSGDGIWIKPGVVGKVLDIAWVKENSGGQTHAVATRSANAFGFYDMYGNVWEWMYGEDSTIGCRHGFAFDDAASECSVKRGWHKSRDLRFDHCGLRLAARVRPFGEMARQESKETENPPLSVEREETPTEKARKGLIGKESEKCGANGSRAVVADTSSDRCTKVVAQKLQTCDFLLNKEFKRDAKVYLCLFSASWCGPCRAEMPRIAKTYADTLKADPDIELIHFSCDRNDEKAMAWAKEHNVKFPVVKPNGGNPLDLHTSGIPHLFVLKADGMLVEEGHPGSLFTEEKLRTLGTKSMVAKPVAQKEGAGVGKTAGVTIVNGVEWTYEVVDGSVVLGGNGKTAVPTATSGALAIPGTIDGMPVRGINGGAFRYCRRLMSVTIPKSVTKIDGSAFPGCSGIASFDVDRENPAFASIGGMLCTKDGKTVLAGVKGNLTIPYGVTTIGSAAFYAYWGLQSVAIPSSVTHIGDLAFYNCSGLKAVAIPEGVTHIGHSAFGDCWGMESVTVPSSVVDIGNRAFSCDSGRMKSITVSSGNPKFATVNGLLCTKDGRTVVAGVDGDVVIPECATSIDDNAFYKCKGLTSVTIPSCVERIGNAAFEWCASMKSFSVSTGNSKYASANGMLCTKDGKTLIAGINGNAVVPDGVTTIVDSAFSGRKELMSVTIPSSVRNIGSEVFRCCRNMTSVTMCGERPDVGRSVFGYCSKLAAIHVPANAKSWAGMKTWQGIPLVFDAKEE